MRPINDAGLALLKTWEGFSATIYQDDAGKNTVGFGHLLIPGEVLPFPPPWTEEQAEEVLLQDVAEAQRDVERGCGGSTIMLSDNEYAALVCWEFNCGAGPGSQVYRCIASRDYAGVPEILAEWIHIHRNGEVLVDHGLVNRRAAEIALWNLGGPPGDSA